MKRLSNLRCPVLWLILVTFVFVPWDSAHAYVGPGLGVGAIAVVLGVIGSVFLAIFAVLWYPFKRFLKKRKAARVEPQQAEE